MKRNIYRFKAILFYLFIFLLGREIFIHSDFGQSINKKGKEFFILAKERLNGIFDFSGKIPAVDIPRVERPAVPRVDIPHIERVEIPKVEKPQVPKVDIPDIPRIR